MDKIKNLSIEKIGKLIYEYNPHSWERESTNWIRFRKIIIIALIFFLILTIFIPNLILIIIIASLIGLIITSLNDYDYYFNRFRIYENGFEGKIIRKAHSDFWFNDSPIGYKFIEYKELQQINKVKLHLKNGFRSFIKLSFFKGDRILLCYFPYNEKICLKKLLNQIVKKGINIKINKKLLLRNI